MFLIFFGGCPCAGHAFLVRFFLECLSKRVRVRTEDVLVVFGLVVTGSNRLIGVSTEQPYGFSTDFRPEDPWAQRQSLSLCTNHPEARRDR